MLVFSQVSWLVGWVVGSDLMALLTQFRSHRTFKVIYYFEKNIFYYSEVLLFSTIIIEHQ